MLVFYFFRCALSEILFIFLIGLHSWCVFIMKHKSFASPEVLGQHFITRALALLLLTDGGQWMDGVWMGRSQVGHLYVQNTIYFRNMWKNSILLSVFCGPWNSVEDMLWNKIFWKLFFWRLVLVFFEVFTIGDLYGWMDGQTHYRSYASFVGNIYFCAIFV